MESYHFLIYISYYSKFQSKKIIFLFWPCKLQEKITRSIISPFLLIIQWKWNFFYQKIVIFRLSAPCFAATICPRLEARLFSSRTAIRSTTFIFSSSLYIRPYVRILSCLSFKFHSLYWSSLESCSIFYREFSAQNFHCQFGLWL